MPPRARPLLLALPIALGAGLLPVHPDIVGTWHGTSTCVDHATDRFCHDEVVIYDVDTLSGTDSVVMKADKVVNGVREFMGTLHLGFDTTERAWASEFTSPRSHGRWSFQVRDSLMTGTLVELPSRRLVRRVEARRSKE